METKNISNNLTSTVRGHETLRNALKFYIVFTQFQIRLSIDADEVEILST